MIASRSRFPGDWNSRRELALALLLSFFAVLQSQVALAAVPRYFPSLPILAMLPISGVLMVATLGLGRFCRILFGISAHAPASVFFHELFLWGIFSSVIRDAVPTSLIAAMNLQFALLIFGLYRIISSDPGVVENSSSESESNPQSKGPFPLTRVRFCRRCNAHVLGFDHHCPAFGNCIGRKNHRLFMALLVGFLVAEASYGLCSMQFISASLDKASLKINFVISTMIFSLLQIFWQVVFLIWHVYCICINMTTDEWINWRRYPEFHEDSEFESELGFKNPYDNGVFSNVKEFLVPR